MRIDIRTIILIIGVAHLMQVLVFTHQYKANKNIKGPGWWLLWSAFETFAFMLILLREIPAMLWLIIIFQDGIVLAGTIFLYIGVVRFFDKKINWKFIIPFFASFMLVHLFFFFIKDDIQMRSLFFDIYLSIVGFLTAICLFKNKFPSIALTANFNAAIFIVHGCIFVYRSIMIMMGTSVTDIFSPTLFNFIQYFDALVVGLLWTFGLIIMLNQRLNFEISEAKIHFEQIFTTSPDAVVITRLSDGLFIDCNDNYTRISGFTKEDIKGKSSIGINIYKNNSDREKIVNILKKKSFFENHELLLKRKNGEIFPGLMSAKMIMLNTVPHIISVTRDISNLKEAENEIRLKNEELHKLNAVKDKLFSIIGHDLRSPFTTIMGFTDLLENNLRKYPLEEIEEMIGIIQNSARHTYKLLENLLNWAKTQTGQMHIYLEKISLNFIIQDVVYLSKAQAFKKNISINYLQKNELIVTTDENLLNTVLRNLVNNAIKFTNQNGIINISAIMKNDVVEISVSDNGIGLEDELKKNLFVDIIRQSQRGTNQEKGTGLGLTICKEFIEKLGGKIWVESEVGKGSTFYFTVPYN